MESIKDKLRKIKALADKGFYGEAQNAKRILNNLLDKYSLTIDDLMEDEKKLRKFKVERVMYIVFNHIVANVIGEERTSKMYWFKNKPSVQYIELTDYEYAEIHNLFDFHKRQYKKEYKKQIDIIITAYIHKHNLTLKASPDDKDRKEMSMDEFLDILSAIRRMEDNYYVKQLTE